MLVFYLYNLLNLILFPFYLIILIIRVCKKKDDLHSVVERLSSNMKRRLGGKLIWVHVASVGESVVAITLVNALNKLKLKYNFLITTGTLSSANILKKCLPKNASQQFVPLDNYFVIRKFINHWKPDLGIFIESELWPCLITESAKHFKLILLNARLSDKSYARWKKRKKIFQFIVSHFKKVIVQSKVDLKKYQNLGYSEAINLENLKFTNKELKVDNNKLKSLKKVLANKKIFVAGSTHYEDEEVTLQMIKFFKKKNIEYYPIIILRHPKRRTEVARQCEKMDLSFSLRSATAIPSLNDDLYIVDSFGELGLFYSLSHITFIGGSFKHGGHNLVEPAYFKNVIIFGPDMSNFQNIADDMISNQVAMQIKNGKQLIQQVEFLLNDINDKEVLKYSENAVRFVKNREKILKNYIEQIKKFLE